MIRSVTVYCSARQVAPVYYVAARDLGRAIAVAGWILVYGGNNVGTMNALASAARAEGGKVVGITPQLMVDQRIHDPACDELVVTQGMRDRKEHLERRGDAFVILPGGLGTLEELSEILVGRALGYHDKPIVILNVAGFYDPLLTMIEHGIEQDFIKPSARELYHVSTNVADAIAYLKSARQGTPQPIDPTSSAAE